MGFFNLWGFVGFCLFGLGWVLFCLFVWVFGFVVVVIQGVFCSIKSIIKHFSKNIKYCFYFLCI